MFKRILIIVISTIALLLLVASFSHKDQPHYLSQDLNADQEIITVNDIDIVVDIADNPAKQTLGLSNRTYMPDNNGMLFIFDQSFIPSFWMKDMMFSLDMLWIDTQGVVVGITKNISPDTFPNTFQPPSPVKYVLEVNAGWSDRNNIKIGDKMTRY